VQKGYPETKLARFAKKFEEVSLGKDSLSFKSLDRRDKGKKKALPRGGRSQVGGLVTTNRLGDDVRDSFPAAGKGS